MSLRQPSEYPPPAGSAPARRWSPFSGGVAGNERLIALTGMLLLGLLFLEGMTLPAIRPMLPVHIFIGLLLLPPILLKLGSTGYRFLLYYAGNVRYRAAGPPSPALRLIAPFLVLTTIGLMGTGVMLLLAGPQQGDLWLRLHKVSFFFWFFLMTIHVLAYIMRAPALAFADFIQRGRGGRSFVAGALSRESLVVGSALLGIVIAVVGLSYDSSWVHWASLFHGDH